ncbi:hypothetical protein C1Y42_22385 [Pantoea sp. ICBG 985]|uniref:DUF1173 family protein n=1 Tax=Pantoea sp. ICBG 985 TaxID=2071683 RepID=UPI000CE4250E|nr:DUF1173 family protein [Pantoea sp. ICBG 985]PPC67093.1 hypothetical protein C1Y42_22385 [Pantoea sp. ICBG 985]
MTAKKVYPVRFAGLRGTQECSASLRTDNPEQWQRWLKHARDNKATTVITCLCKAPEVDTNSRRLNVRLSQKTDQCCLASWAFSGHEHASDCRFYSVWPDERQAAIYTSDVVKAAPDGQLIVRLPTGLQKKDPVEQSQHGISVSTALGKRRRQPSMRLLGLLHLLWEQSGINVWHPAFDRKKRYPGWISWRLSETASRIRIGRLPLHQSLMLMAMKDSQQAELNRQITKVASSGSRRLIVISQLAAWSVAADERLQHTLPLGLFAGFPVLTLPQDVRERLSRSFSRELADWRRGAKVIVICEAEPPETTFVRKDGRNVPRITCRIIDAALMTVSPRFIPLDSRYEGEVEEKLWQEKRAFIKPLRYDGEEDVFPDFVLKDVPGVDGLPMEVFGMNTPEYLLRKHEKIGHYDSEFGQGNWWYWEATASMEMPPFPR